MATELENSKNESDYMHLIRDMIQTRYDASYYQRFDTNYDSSSYLRFDTNYDAQINNFFLLFQPNPSTEEKVLSNNYPLEGAAADDDDDDESDDSDDNVDAILDRVRDLGMPAKT